MRLEIWLAFCFGVGCGYIFEWWRWRHWIKTILIPELDTTRKILSCHDPAELKKFKEKILKRKLRND